jgi:hypothetical protein
MFTKDGIRTLVDVIIIDPTRVNLLPSSCEAQRFAAFDVAQAKEKSYMTNTPLIDSSLSQLRYLDVYINKPICFYTIMPMPFGASKGQKALIFLSWLFFSVKKFQ